MQASTLHLDFRNKLGCSSNLSVHIQLMKGNQNLWNHTKKKCLALWSLFDLHFPRVPSPCRFSLRATGSGCGMSDLSSVEQCLMTVRDSRGRQSMFDSHLPKTFDFQQVFFIPSASQFPASIVEIIFLKLRGLFLGRRNNICKMFKHLLRSSTKVFGNVPYFQCKEIVDLIFTWTINTLNFIQWIKKMWRNSKLLPCTLREHF